MARFIEATDALRVLSEYYNYRTDVDNYRLALAISKVPTADVVERKDLDKITEAHEKIGYEKGNRDGHAQAIEDAIEAVGINTWAGSRITKLQHA